MSEEETKKSETVADSTESEMKPSTDMEVKQPIVEAETSDAPKEAAAETITSQKEEGVPPSDDRVEFAKMNRAEETVQVSSVESSADKPLVSDESPQKCAVESSTDEKKSAETSDEGRPADEKKNPEKTVKPSDDEKQSSEKDVKLTSTEKAVEKTIQSEQTVMEADSTEDDTAANSFKEAAGGGDYKVKEHLKLLGEGKKAFANSDFLSAADYFGRAAELSRIVYGEFSEKNGETLFLYGATMLECWKSENTVLGENMKGKDEDEGYDDEEDDEDEEGGAEEEEEVAADAEKMETDESEATELKTNGDAEAPTVNGEAKVEVLNGEVKENGDDEKVNGSVEGSEANEQNEAHPSTSNAEDKGEDKEDEDNYLKVAWEMLDLAKIIYHKVDDKKRLADTYMKLGEVAVESGHLTATEEMKKCLDLRQIFLEPHDRVIAETHFNIGVAFSVFKLFDEATKHFEMAKEILQKKMKVLKDLNTAESLKEFTEIEGIIPELNEKIQDMADSKRDEMSKGKAASDDSNGCSSSAVSASNESKPASNISHLVKRKRKMEDIVAEKSTKVCRIEGDDQKAPSENPDAKD